VGYLKKSQGLKHTIRNPMCVSVYTIFWSGAFLNFNNVIIKKDFHNFLNIMIVHYIKKSLAKESTFLDFILCDIKVYLFKNNIYKIILLKKLPKKKGFFTFMKMEDILNHVYKPCEEFEIFYFKKGFFFKRGTINMW
jgi:hypothetical protein